MKGKNMKGKMRNKILLIGTLIGIVLVGLGLYIVSNSPTWKEYKGIGMRPTWDVADNILSAPNNRIFANEIYKVGYQKFLHGKGPFTVFLPTDKAYANLPPVTNIFINKPGNTGELRSVLQYHVVKGKYLSSMLKDGLTLKTIQGEELKFTKKDGYWVINDYAYIQTSDVVSKNGVIHIITNYLIPPSMIRVP